MGLVSALACQSPQAVPEPRAALIRVKCEPAVPAPDELRVRAYDDGGVVWYNVRVPESGALPSPKGQDLGTILLAPGPIQGALRVHVRGLVAGERVADGSLRIASLASGTRTFDLVLSTTLAIDSDGDDVPDAIDNCLGLANPEQRACPGSDAASSADAADDARADGLGGAGGQSTTGGAGGSLGDAGLGGNSNSGGTPNAGGVTGIGGALTATGGMSGTGGQGRGGTIGAGGILPAGGTSGSGGTPAAGGVTAMGGTRSTGGVVASGGVAGAGGAPATGGASALTCPSGYVFCDNFESGSTSAWTVKSGTWSVTTDATAPAGDQHVYSSGTSSNAVSQAGTRSYTNATLEARIKATRFNNGSSANAVGIFLRDNGNNSYALAFGADGTLSFRRAAASSALHACTVGQNIAQSGVGLVSTGCSGGICTSWFQLKLVVSGTTTNGITATAYVDAGNGAGYDRVLQCTQNPGSQNMVASGTAGVFIKGNTQAEFDDVLISIQ